MGTQVEPKHGTYAGFQAHIKTWKTEVCNGCRIARNQYMYFRRHHADYQNRADKFILLGVAQ